MNSSLRFSGLPVSEGTATGRLHIADVATVGSVTPDEVRAAFAAVAADRSGLAERLRGAGRHDEAAIVDVGALIAADPALVEPAVAAVRGGEDAAAAVCEAAEAQAAVLEALPTPELAERAGDVRQVASAVLDRLGGTGAAALPPGAFILVRREVSPADLIELAESGLVGAVSVRGGASSHAAIIARGLGLPMIAGTDAAVLAAPDGQLCVLDADSGELIIGPDLAATTSGPASASGPAARPGPLSGAGPVSGAAAGLAAASGNGAGRGQPVAAGPARTADGREITVLCNVASAAETRRGLAAGAAGVGLLRTEIPYSGALAWPTLSEHRAHLAPILGLLDGRPATVRLLDFSGDKIPPFLQPSPGQPPADAGAGLAALLAHRTALADQLRAVLETGRSAGLAICVPMVSSPGEVSRVREAVSEVAAALGVTPPPVGIMVELQATATAAGTFAAAADFFSIGTNDLTGQVLGLDRRDPAAGPALAAHPRVLALIARVAGAGRRAGIPVSVCGDSAADPVVLPLLVGLGVGTLSVPAARVQRVRAWVAERAAPAYAALAAAALQASSLDEVRKLVLA
jgi:phosphoenolpyruvate-protein kinase (PTS system EI component)